MQPPLTDRGLEMWTRVLLPSLSFPADELASISGIEHYEERFFVLALAHAQRARAVYVTSVPIDPETVDYYCSLAPDPVHTRERITLISLDDPSQRTLSEKLAERPDAISAIKDAAGDEAYVFPFNITHREPPLLDALGLPLYGAPFDLVHFGSKTGSRLVAKRAGARVLPGDEGLSSFIEIERAIERLSPAANGVVVKFNEGFSGMGNVILERSAVRSPLSASTALFCSSEMNWDAFERKVVEQGAIVEELAVGDGLDSPSVQLQILPSGRPEVLSTHDQILGDPRGQVYLGCRFPASDHYREEIVSQATAMGDVLAAEGVTGPFGVDFVVLPERGAFVTEINLRMGGTTHPFATARFVTRADYVDSHLVASDGSRKFYVGTDNLKSKTLLGRRPGEVITTLERSGLAFDPARGTGVTLHLLGAVEPYGKLGAVAIGDSREEARALADELERSLLS